VSEQQQQAPQQVPVAPTPGGAAPSEFRARVEKLLGDILGLMGFPARLDMQDAADGNLSVALHFDAGPPPGVENGRRSQVVDSLQFLLNKMMHRPGAERRWVVLGAGAHPEPRQRREPQAAQAQAAQAQAPAALAPAAPAPAAPRPAAQAAAAPAKASPRSAAPAPAARPAPPARGDADERSVTVEEDAALREAARRLAEKSSGLGRFYALAAMKLEDRARVLKAVEGVAGVKVTAEGEGRNRRVVFTPDKPAPLPKRSLLPDDDEEDLDE
jgi:predicted RNA-binding protein Jag